MYIYKYIWKWATDSINHMHNKKVIVLFYRLERFLKAFKMFLLYIIILGIEVLSCTTCLMLIHKISWVGRFSSLGFLSFGPTLKCPQRKSMYLLQKSFPLKKVPLANGWNKVECASWILRFCYKLLQFALNMSAPDPKH